MNQKFKESVWKIKDLNRDMMKTKGSYLHGNKSIES